MALPLVPEAFHAWFPKVFLAASPLVSSACWPLRPTKLLVRLEKKPLVPRVPRSEAEPIGLSNVHSFCFIITMFDGSISKDFTRKSTKNLLEQRVWRAKTSTLGPIFFLHSVSINVPSYSNF